MATLRELVHGKGWDATEGIIGEVAKFVPELDFFDAKIIAGTSFQAVKMTSLPTTAFRSINNGIDASDEGYTLGTYNLALLAGLVQRDKAAVTADPTGKDDTLARAAVAQIRSAMKTLAKAVWYGDGSGAAGANIFPGVAASVKSGLTVKAGGSTANVQTSVYLVGNGCEDMCGLFFGENSELLGRAELEWKEGLMTGANDKPVPCFWTSLDSWAGFGIKNSNAVARIANLSATDSKHLTDELLAEAVSLYEEANDGLRPAAIFAPFAEVRALQKSRSTVIRTSPREGSSAYAATPTDFEGIPIKATNNIKLTEAVVA